MISLTDEGWYQVNVVLNYGIYHGPKKNPNSTQLTKLGKAAGFKFEFQFEPLPGKNSPRLFQKIIEGFDCKINDLAFGAPASSTAWACLTGDWGGHKHKAFPSWQQSLMAAISWLQEMCYHSLQYWLTSRVKKVCNPNSLQESTIWL